MEPALSMHRYLQAHSSSIIPAMRAFSRQSSSEQVASAAHAIFSILQELQPELAQHRPVLNGPDDPEGTGSREAFAVYLLYNKHFFPLMQALDQFEEASAANAHVTGLFSLPALPLSAWHGYLDFFALTRFGEHLRQKSVCGDATLRYKASFETEGHVVVTVFLDQDGAVNAFDVDVPLPERGATLAHDVESAKAVLHDLVEQATVVLEDKRNWPSATGRAAARRKKAKTDSSRILALLPKADLVRLAELLEANPEIVRKAAAHLL